MWAKKFYYTNYRDWIGQRSPEEAMAEDLRIQAMVDRAMEAVGQTNPFEKEISSDRDKRFTELAEIIDEVAARLHFDLLIEAHGTEPGELTLTADVLTMPECTPEIRKAFLRVLSYADDIRISCIGTLIEIKLYFQRFDIAKEG